EAHPDDSERGIQFWGSSFVCGPQGEMLAQAPADSAAAVVAKIVLGSVVSGGGTPDGAARRRPVDLPHRHRLGPQRQRG
ncbi:MAG: hypothetical protein M1392_04680, partial [Gammaproteobacteria bacterium]|nr:hypothetical protein [Gammaproteobacteria bacterium]